METSNARKTNKNKNMKLNKRNYLVTNMTKNTRIAGKTMFSLSESKTRSKTKTKQERKTYQKQGQHKNIKAKTKKHERKQPKKKEQPKNESNLGFKKGY